MDQQVSADSASAQYWRGLVRGLSIALALVPFGLLFGALSVQNGLSVFETVLSSALIFAGASQMVGVELFGQNVPPWLIVLSIFAVNFRHVLYSASFGRHARHWTSAQRLFGFFFLTDPQYAEAESRHEKGTPVAFAWYMGLATALYVGWVANAAVGGWFGGLIPDTHAFGIDFLLPIYFLALVMGFRKRSLWLPVVLASGLGSVLAFHFIGSPWHVSIGALAGIALAVVLAPSQPEAAS
jgi:predicted branched-subunit amino acid permease